MEHDRFDAAVRKWGTATRRTVVGLGLGSGLTSLFGLVEAKKKKGKKGKKKCKAQPTATTCAGKCGVAKNNCKKTVTCGACPDGQCCSGKGACGACLTFVTSTTHWGDFDGLSGADAVCQELAEAAGLPGEYLAWLGDTTGSPSTRFVRATVPYTLVDGTVIADDWDELTDGQIASAILLDELGHQRQLGTPQPWTNVNPDGTAGGIEPNAHCDNWTSSLGGAGGHIGNNGFALLGYTNAGWTKFRSWDCSMSWELYCFQQR